MRVLVVSANQERSPDPVAPLGACYVATATAERGHAVELLDLCFSEDVQQDVGAAVRAHRPEVIGLSLRNVDNCAWPDTVSYLPHYRRVVAACRAVSEAPVVLGGSAKLFEATGGGIVPANVFVAREAPHAALFPRVSCVVYHGGSGTTAAAARAGAAQVILPMMLDQFHHQHHGHDQSHNLK